MTILSELQELKFQYADLQKTLVGYDEMISQLMFLTSQGSILDKLWLLDVTISDNSHSMIILADTKSEAERKIMQKMEIDTNIKRWFKENGIQYSLNRAKDVEGVWSKEFPNILAIT